MNTLRKIIFVASLVSTIVTFIRKQRAHRRSFADGVPVVQPAQPYEPGQAPQPQDLRIAQNVLE